MTALIVPRPSLELTLCPMALVTACFW